MRIVNTRHRATAAAALAALGLAGGVAGLAVAADSQSHDVTAAAGSPTDQQLAYSKIVGGTGTAVPADSTKAVSLARLASEQGATLAASARLVRAPQGAKDTEWIVVPTDSGGVCIATQSSALCGSDAATIAAGRGIVTEYPADKIISTNPKQGTAIVEPSNTAGQAYGVAPPGATAVKVVARDGSTLQQARVDRGLYAIAAPAQSTPADIVFTSDNTTVASRPIP